MKFSIVIALAPYRNAEVLDSLRNLNYDRKQYEIIVEKGYSPSENRNKGVGKTKGEIIAFFDDDAIIEKNILNEAENFFNKFSDIAIVGGPQLTPKTDKGFAKISGYALSSRFGGWKVSRRYKKDKLNLDADETFLTSANLFCRKKVFDKIKFNTALWPGEDPDLISRAKKQGFKIAYNPKLIVDHRRRDNFADLAKQIFNYGVIRPKKEKFAETLKRPFFLVPAVFSLYVIFLVLLGLTNGITAYVINQSSQTLSTKINVLLLAPLLLYFLINIFSSLYLSTKNKDLLAFFVLPFTFLVIHLSYGFGIIFGLVGKRKIIR